jgi:hypothetical protein
VHSWDRRAVGVWPTNDGLAITYCAWPASEFAGFRADPERALLETLDGAGDLGQRVGAARRVGPIRRRPTCRTRSGRPSVTGGRWPVTPGW